MSSSSLIAMARECQILRVFTRDEIGGNHLGVVTDVAGLDGDNMHAIAAELGFSETVFCDITGEIPSARIFTPAIEMPFAGHPLVGLAWALDELLETPVTRIRCPVGDVEVSTVGGATWIQASGGQPVDPVDPPPLDGDLAVSVSMPMPYLLVRMSSARQVADLVPPPVSFGAVYVWAWEDPGRVVKSRFFAGEAGVPEDPATGSAASGPRRPPQGSRPKRSLGRDPPGRRDRAPLHHPPPVGRGHRFDRGHRGPRRGSGPGRVNRHRLIAVSAVIIALVSCSGISEPTLPTTILEVEDNFYDGVQGLGSASEAVIVGTVESVESIGTVSEGEDPNPSEFVKVDVDVDETLKGDAVDSVSFAWEAFTTDGEGNRELEIVTAGLRTPAEDDILLLFLVPETEERLELYGAELTHSPLTRDGIAWVDEGMVIRAAERFEGDTGAGLMGMTVDEVWAALENEPDDATAEFCDEGAGVLVDDSIGDDPEKMRLQMEALAQAASDLPDEARLTLMQHVEPLIAELHLAERERAVGGWSSAEVVAFVSDLCGRDDLMAWIVQP